MFKKKIQSYDDIQSNEMEPFTSRTAIHRRSIIECESDDEDIDVDRIDANIKKINKKDISESDRKLKIQIKDKPAVSKHFKTKDKTEKSTKNLKF